MSHGVNRGKLKRDKQDERHNFITDLISECPNIIFDIFQDDKLAKNRIILEIKQFQMNTDSLVTETRCF